MTQPTDDHDLLVAVGRCGRPPPLERPEALRGRDIRPAQRLRRRERLPLVLDRARDGVAVREAREVDEPEIVLRAELALLVRERGLPRLRLVGPVGRAAPRQLVQLPHDAGEEPRHPVAGLDDLPRAAGVVGRDRVLVRQQGVDGGARLVLRDRRHARGQVGHGPVGGGRAAAAAAAASVATTAAVAAAAAAAAAAVAAAAAAAAVGVERVDDGGMGAAGGEGGGCLGRQLDPVGLEIFRQRDVLHQ